MAKTPLDIHNETVRALNLTINDGIDIQYEAISKGQDIAFKQAARMIEEGKTADDIRQFSKELSRVYRNSRTR